MRRVVWIFCVIFFLPILESFKILHKKDPCYSGLICTENGECFCRLNRKLPVYCFTLSCWEFDLQYLMVSLLCSCGACFVVVTYINKYIEETKNLSREEFYEYNRILNQNWKIYVEDPQRRRLYGI